jgi:hypothetical protein
MFVGGSVQCLVSQGGGDTFHYVWSNGTDTGSSGILTLVASDLGTTITCTVTVSSSVDSSSASAMTTGWGPILAAPPPTALPPSVADLQSWSRIDFSSLDAPYTDAELQIQIVRATAYLTAVTGRAMDATMPPPLVPIAQDAYQLEVEQEVFKSQPDYVETSADDLIQSFTAGNYSETRKEPGRATRRNVMPIGLPDINPDPRLNTDIWLLCTPEMQQYWRFVLQNASIPTFEVTEADWGNYDGLYPYSHGVGAFQGPVLDPTVWGA